MRRRGAVGVALAALALAGCKREDMYTQNNLRTWDRTTFFANQSAMQHPVAGTVARNAVNQEVPQPSRITAALLARGQQRYDIFCTPCHALSGDGEGRIVERGFPKPPPLYGAGLVRAKAQFLYDVITRGHGVMYSYADRVPSADRWAIVAYIRALQASASATLADVPADKRASLE